MDTGINKSPPRLRTQDLLFQYRHETQTWCKLILLKINPFIASQNKLKMEENFIFQHPQVFTFVPMLLEMQHEQKLLDFH